MLKFRDLRMAAGLTIAQAGELLGVSSSTISAYERGQLTPAPREVRILVGLGRVKQLRVTKTETKQSMSSSPGDLSDSPSLDFSIGICSNSIQTIQPWRSDEIRG